MPDFLGGSANQLLIDWFNPLSSHSLNSGLLAWIVPGPLTRQQSVGDAISGSTIQNLVNKAQSASRSIANYRLVERPDGRYHDYDYGGNFDGFGRGVLHWLTNAARIRERLIPNWPNAPDEFTLSVFHAAGRVQPNDLGNKGVSANFTGNLGRATRAEIYFGVNGTTNSLLVAYNFFGGTQSSIPIPGNAQQWQLGTLTGSVSKKIVKLFVNGCKVDEQIAIGTLDPINATSFYVGFKSGNNSTAWYQTKVWNRMLTDAEVIADHQQAFRGNPDLLNFRRTSTKLFHGVTLPTKTLVINPSPTPHISNLDWSKPVSDHGLNRNLVVWAKVIGDTNRPSGGSGNMPPNLINLVNKFTVGGDSSFLNIGKYVQDTPFNYQYWKGNWANAGVRVQNISGNNQGANFWNQPNTVDELTISTLFWLEGPNLGTLNPIHQSTWLTSTLTTSLISVTLNRTTGLLTYNYFGDSFTVTPQTDYVGKWMLATNVVKFGVIKQSYLNGELLDSSAHVPTSTPASKASGATYPFVAMQKTSNTAPQKWAYTKIWTRALRPAEVLAEYNDGLNGSPLTLRYRPRLRVFDAPNITPTPPPSAINYYTMAAAQGSFTLTGNAANLTRAFKLTADQASFALAGKASNLVRGLKVAAAVQSFTLTGNAANLIVGKGLTASTGSFTVTGNASALTKQAKMPAVVQSFTLTGNATNLVRGLKLTASVRAFTLTGNAVNLVAGKGVAAAAGSFALTGNAVNFSLTRKVLAGTGSFTLTGNATGLTRQLKMMAAAGACTLTGKSASLAAARQATVSAGAYSVTGITTSLAAARTLSPSVSPYAVTGNASALARGLELGVSAGSFALVGGSVTIARTRALVAAVCSYSLAGLAPQLARARIVGVTPGQFALTGNASTIVIRHPSLKRLQAEVCIGTVSQGEVRIATLLPAVASVSLRASMEVQTTHRFNASLSSVTTKAAE